MKVKIRIIIAALIAISNQTTAQPLPSYVPSNGLVGWWPFNGNANDESGNGNHGTVNGATLTVDRNGNVNSAYDFDGINDFIQISDSPDLSGQSFSISTWFKSYSFADGQAIIIAKDAISTLWQININNYSTNQITEHGYLFGPVYIGESEQTIFNNNQDFIDSSWHFCALTFNHNTGYSKLFADGSLISESYVGTNSYQINSAILIGIGVYLNHRQFNGEIDDIAIYNRALTPSEITALYNGTTDVSGCTNSNACNYNASATLDDGNCTFPSQTYLNCDGTCINDTDADGVCNELETPTLPAYLPTNGLVGYWPFNGNANDESGNENHGTVNGATLTADRNGNANSAFGFDGISSRINLSSNSIYSFGSNNFTIIHWFRSNPLSGDHRHSLRNINLSNGTYYELSPCNSSNNLPSFGFHNGNIYFETFSNGMRIDDNQWHLLVGIRKNDSIYFSIDGNVHSSLYIGMSTSTINLNSLQAGSFYFMLGNGPVNHFIDDVAIFNRALTTSEISSLYTGASSNNGGGNGGMAGTPAASVPAGIPYQAVIRNNAGAALGNAPVSVRFTLHQNTTDGSVEYQETQSLTTNAMGLINTQIGTFASINWSNTTKFIQVEVNTGNGFVDIGTQQLMSVPFAFQANKATAIKNAGLPVYADNAAALAGGLVPGDMYRTATGDLKIVY